MACVFLLKIQCDGAQPEIQDLETVRGQLHQLLTMSERIIPGIIGTFSTGNLLLHLQLLFLFYTLSLSRSRFITSDA